jgi:hypothetical protein
MEKQNLSSTNSESSASVASKNSPIDTAISIFEVISLVLMLVPYFMIEEAIRLSSVPGKDYFFLFPDGLISILPTGVFALSIQLVRKFRKQSASTLSNVVLKSSIVTTIFGVLAIMLIYAVAG